MVKYQVELTAPETIKSEKGLTVDNLLDDLYNVNSHRKISLPSPLPKTSKGLLSALRKKYKDDVTDISLVMNHFFPQEFVYYRVCSLEPELFRAFQFFADEFPQLKPGFDKIGKRGVERYLKLNERLLELGGILWPKDKNVHIRLRIMLFEVFADLFKDPEPYKKYWVIATKEDYWDSFDASDQIESWSVNKEVSDGDIVFLYRTKPVSAITDVVRVDGKPEFYPYLGWDGFFVGFKRLCRLEGIPISMMRKDRVLGGWSVVRRSFQGVMTEYVPHHVYNRLLDFVPVGEKQAHGLLPEKAVLPPVGRTFASEEQFGRQLLEKVLRDWRFKFRRQFTVPAWVGSQKHTLRVDHLVTFKNQRVTLFENKLEINTSEQRTAAMEQGLSYAKLLGLPTFVVAAPQGMWMYQLNGQGCKEVDSLRFGDAVKRFESFRLQLLSLAGLNG